MTRFLLVVFFTAIWAQIVTAQSDQTQSALQSTASNNAQIHNKAKAPALSFKLNHNDILALDAETGLDINDPKSVFNSLLKQIAPVTTVFPTENYYYFSFDHAGQRYVGNIRLSQPQVNKGQIFFNYFNPTSPWHYDEIDRFTIFDEASGVSVKQTGTLEYTITSDDTSVRFQLNDLRDVSPPAGTLKAGETYLGPVFDESGMEFFLIYNRQRKEFLFLVNERSMHRDRYIPATNTNKAVSGFFKGVRTGFVYWQSPEDKRTLLVAVHQFNITMNNSFDGPFDQLPDNFLKDNALQKAILNARPDLTGKIDEYGNFTGVAERFLIAPYLDWGDEEDLTELFSCVKTTTPEKQEACIVDVIGAP